MESSRHAARNCLTETMAKLDETIPAANPDDEVTLNAVTPHLHAFKSTVGREVWMNTFIYSAKLNIPSQVWFASLHCVHHWSMVGTKFEFTLNLFYISPGPCYRWRNCMLLKY